MSGVRPTVVAALVCAALLAGSAQAGEWAPSRAPGPEWGISDQTPASFSEGRLRALGLGHARLVTPWNSIFTEPERLESWIRAARAARLEPFISFERVRGSECPQDPCPTVDPREYAKAFGAFRERYPDITTISPWNEANSGTQPTGKNPELAARIYNVARDNCTDCTLVAADVLDQRNLVPWLERFRKVAKGAPRLWGLHNYSDTNRFRTTGIDSLLGAVPGKVWLTETGGVVRFQTQDGREALPYDEERAAKAIQFLFQTVARHRDRVQRVYVYQWRRNFEGDRFDAGLVGFDGVSRPSYEVLRRGLPTAGRVVGSPPR